MVAIENDIQVQGYGPRTEVVPPAAIRHRVIEAIFWYPRVGFDRIAVDVAAGGDITINGLVGSSSEAREAGEDAVAAGAAHVDNRIRVVSASSLTTPAGQ